MDNVKIEEMDWMTYRDLVSTGEKKIMIPVGAIEQHGPHMSLNPDVLIPEYIAKEIAKRTSSVLVAPAISYGYKSQVKSGGGNFFPGTTCVSGSALENYVYDVMHAFVEHGCREIVLLNGHFENSAFIAEAADRLAKHFGGKGIDIKVFMLSYWDFVGEEVIAKIFPEGFTGWAVEHGGILETSIMLCIHPKLVNMDKAVHIEPAVFPPYDVFPPEPTWVPSSGTLSSPVGSTAEKGEIILEECVTKISNMFE